MSRCPIAGDANVYELIELSNTKQTLPGASILRGLGEQSPTFLKVGCQGHSRKGTVGQRYSASSVCCLLYTSDAADE